MHNELMWVALLFVNFGVILTAFRLFGRLGLMMVPVMGMILINIQVTEQIELFGLITTLGNVLYGGVFFATDLLNEVYRKRDARLSVLFGLFSLVVMTVVMTLSLQVVPTPAGEPVAAAMATIFGLMPRIMVASVTAYLVSQFYDIWVYWIIRRRLDGLKWLWLRNNLSTMTSQLLDSFVFVGLAFWGAVPPGVWFQIFITTYVLKLIVAVADTPFLYLARFWYDRGKVNQLNVPDFDEDPRK